LALASILQAPRQAAAEGLGRVEIGAMAPDFFLRGADNATHGPRDVKGKLLVLEWTNPVCPFTAAAYRSGAMQALQREVRRHGGAWFAIDTAAKTAPGWMEPSAAAHRLAGLGAEVSAFLYDETGAVGRLYGARTTPTLYIIDRGGRLRYQGALAASAPEAPKPVPYARLALDDIARGRKAAVSETQAEGCPVEY
jgi:hypothetical protein